MGNIFLIHRWFGFLSFLILISTAAFRLQAAEPIPLRASEPIVVVSLQTNKVFFSRKGSQRWDPSYIAQQFDPGDRVRVDAGGWLFLRIGQSVLHFYENSQAEILPPEDPAKGKSRFSFLRGLLYLFHRGEPSDFEIENRSGMAAIRGTEFNMEVDDNGATLLTVIDGVVELRNEQGRLELVNGQQGLMEPGQAPVLRPAIDAINVIQWTLYYPGVLDPDELGFTPAEKNSISNSLEAYRSGDLVAAYNAWPAQIDPASDAARLYHAALQLSVGKVREASEELAAFRADTVENETATKLAAALEKLIAAVKMREPAVTSAPPQFAGEWMAESYYQQSKGRLGEALSAAQHAVKTSPDFGFAWARLAELELAFGDAGRGAEALERALELSPRNAQAVTTRGFFLASRNKTSQALEEFNRAIHLDSRFANAWLGRGLARVRSGDYQAGREDLLIAAALEPQRAVLRSYLGKAYADAGSAKQAAHELDLAKSLDPGDPTAWLYSALLKHQNNEINDAIHDLEKSRALNDNRSIYRSRFQLDQDRAIRSANLARIYRDAGMTDVSVREAVNAVNADYANYSAHLFLADSYALQLDLINLRYETAAQAEFLLANLLSPPGAGLFSPTISQRENSDLFDYNQRLGFVSTTEYLSRGAWTQAAAQFGAFGNLAYNIEGFYRSDNGQWTNGDFEQRFLSFQVKPRITEQDTLFFRVDLGKLEAGDIAQRYDPRLVNTGYRLDEEQEPILLFGYHHEWNPNSHTLLLGSRLKDRIFFNDPTQAALQSTRNDGVIDYATDFFIRTQYEGDLEIYSLEPQHILQFEKHTTVAGLRGQTGRFRTSVFQIDPSEEAQGFLPPFPDPVIDQTVETDFQRFTAYAYHDYSPVESLHLIGGLSYDYLNLPDNFRFAPVNDAQHRADHLSPKAGIVWHPLTSTVLRFGFSRSIGGATIDQSFQIEPTQIAGFNQSFRSLIPEAIAGGNAGAEFETLGASIEHKFPTDTYVILTADQLSSEFDRSLGIYEAEVFTSFPSTVNQNLEYRERSVSLTINQLLGDGFSLGSRYRLSQAQFDSTFTEFGPFTDFRTIGNIPKNPNLAIESVLHQLNLFVVFNHRSGFFAEVDGNWYRQSNKGYPTDPAGDDFWQFNAYAGWRLAQRRVELSVAVLNLGDQDYRLAPLNIIRELPRERTFVARAKFSF